MSLLSVRRPVDTHQLYPRFLQQLDQHRNAVDSFLLDRVYGPILRLLHTKPGDMYMNTYRRALLLLDDWSNDELDDVEPWPKNEFSILQSSYVHLRQLLYDMYSYLPLLNEDIGLAAGLRRGSRLTTLHQPSLDYFAAKCAAAAVPDADFDDIDAASDSTTYEDPDVAWGDSSPPFHSSVVQSSAAYRATTAVPPVATKQVTFKTPSLMERAVAAHPR